MASEDLANGRPPSAPSVNPPQPEPSNPTSSHQLVDDEDGDQQWETIMNEFELLNTKPVKPRPPEKCALLCCFYAEFDIHAGPKIKQQSPQQFMEQHLPVGAVGDTLLREAFGIDSTPIVSTRKTSDPIEAPEPTDTSLSIFKACSEYIIPSSDELTGKILNLSTHDIHLLTRPTIIYNEKYERNNLLFCVGFVLRRNEDPRPFRPALSKLALVLRDMEVEHEFLSHGQDNCAKLLHQVLLSLNSTNNECNVVAASNVLNLKLYRPPKSSEIPLPDHVVPILLQRDWHITVRCDDIVQQSLIHFYFSLSMTGI